MIDKSHFSFNNILYSCVDHKQRGSEQYVKDHALSYLISGESKMQADNGIANFKAGNIGLIKRSQLIKSVKMPPAGGEFKSINIFFSQDLLRDYFAEKKLERVARYSGNPIRILPSDPFLKGYFDSMIPYFDHPEQLNPALAELKTKEALELLLRLDPDSGLLLFDFNEPHKIDLEAYMNQNYRFNVPIERFAQLTGRSLAGFKRDFQKVFAASPGQWLQQKRLAEAHYQIGQKGRRPSEVYLDVGFENLSHFSYAFKKTYGVAPSMI